jgi:predicted amidohydrolase YtcJ
MRRVVSAVAISGNSIMAAGDEKLIAGLIGPHTKIIDLAGKTVLPGLIDAHTHPAESAQDSDKCSLGDKPQTQLSLRAQVAACLKTHPGAPGQWLNVVQVDPSGLTLSRRDLDAMLPDRPMLFSGSDGHTVWANSAALREAGIDAVTPDPHGGHIERDAAGVPTGTLRDNAVYLVFDKMPMPSLARQAALLDTAFDQMRADGITSVQDAAVDAHVMAIYKYLYDAHRLNMRVRGCFHLKDLSRNPADLINEAVAFRRSWAIDPDFLRADSVKIFADGVVEYPTQTAALLTPYLDGAGHPTKNIGPSYFQQNNLNRIVAAADAAGLTVHVHAIGDRAVRGALDAFAYARARNGMRDNRDQIAHLELVDPADVPRFKALGVIANLQLDWILVDDYMTTSTLPYIGPARAREIYLARSLRDAGAVIAGGSDWNVSTFDPFEAMQRGTTRREARGKPALLPEQGLTLQDMVDAYTINAAYALKAEQTTGSLEPGKRADLVVLDRDLFALDPYDIAQTRVLMTYLDGKLVYQRRF